MQYTYTHTKKITTLLADIERAKILITELPVSQSLEEKLRRVSLLKSSLFSARIEGNTLSMREVQMGLTGKERQKREIQNILQAIHFIRSSHCPHHISIPLVKKLHTRVMNELSADAGRFRTEPSAIFNSAGVAVYMTVPPQEIKQRMEDLINGIKKKSFPIPIMGALAHYEFEKIHPFLDGNGRVGRLVSQFILEKGGYGCKGLVSFEEYFEQTKTDYYDLLGLRQKNITLFVQYFLEALVQTAETVIDQLKQIPGDMDDLLLPRRQEILATIRDHRQVSFDFIRRRFMAVTVSTIHYDIQQLLKSGLIKKLGKTRASVYTSLS